MINLTTHDAILIINHMNDMCVDFVKLPNGILVTRIDCVEAIERNFDFT